MQDLWIDRAGMAAKIAINSKGVGSDPDFIERMIGKTHKSVIDWKTLLNSFVQESTCDYSFTPPDRRFSDSDFFLPDFNEKEFYLRDILFMVDTSGSVNSKALTVVYSEIKGAIEQFEGKLNGLIGLFDYEVKSVVPFESVKELNDIVPVGGGVQALM